MQVYLCLWPTGDCTFVAAPSGENAIERVDEFGNAEGCSVEPVPYCLLTVQPQDDGSLTVEMEDVNEGMKGAWEAHYGVLMDVGLEACPSHPRGSGTSGLYHLNQ
jgi:hypothetical protein